jgi:predicted Zn-dependent protease
VAVEANAFVIPGGKVFVFSGLLPIAKNDDGLATILGHEIAHNVARHQAEQMSQRAYMVVPLQFVFLILDYAGFTYGLGRLIGSSLLDLGFARPASRVQESEADFIGLMMMARSCFDPRAAVGVWERMEAASRNNIPEWMSTHPSNENRVGRITQWLPKAEEARLESGCGATSQRFHEFHGALGGLNGGMLRRW